VTLVDVYLLPGLDGTGKLFSRFVAAHPAWARPIPISYEHATENSYEDLVRYASTQIDTTKKHLILGESFSGPIAISLGRASKSNLLGIVLSASFARNLPLIDRIPVPLALLEATVSAAPHQFLADLLLLNGVTDEPLLKEVVAITKSVSPKAIADRIRAAQKVNVRKALEELECPVLYLKALHDRVVHSGACEDISSSDACVEVVEFDSPHLLLQCKPEAAWEAITRWMKNTANNPLESDA
jgi:pimeloyl-[acyl-carrier protein] methyl ester esterase